MYTLKTNSSFDSAHFLAGYEGKCANIHGHRWKVEIEIASEKLQDAGSNRGMIIDFSSIKEELANITDSLDHSLIIEKGSLRTKTYEALSEEKFKVVEVPFRPTAENFAKFFFDELSKKGYRIINSTVYETPNNCASYYE